MSTRDLLSLRVTRGALVLLAGCNDVHGDPLGTPVALIEAEPLSGPAPLTVQFSGQGSYWDRGIGSLAFHRWTFGDGDAAEGPVVQHTYQEAGSSQACLTFGAAEEETLTDTACVTIAVQ